MDDLEVLRADEGLRRLLGRPVMAPSTAHEFLRRVGRRGGLKGLEGVNGKLVRRLMRAKGLRRVTVDFDATFIRSGVRTAAMSYLGERGWMPMLAFIAELGVVLYDELRPGNTSPGADALGVLRRAVEQLPAGTEVAVRADSAWYIAELMDYCHERGWRFCISAAMDRAVRELVRRVGEEDWVEVEPGQWAYDTVHTLNRSRWAYRLIILRRRRQGPQLDLFEGGYRYGAIITNMDLPLREQIRWHRGRCDVENGIKELKRGFGLGLLPSAEAAVNAAWMRLVVLAHNLVAALKQLWLRGGWVPLTIKTIRYRLLRIGAVVVRHARRLWLRLPRGHSHLSALRAALA